MPIVAVRRDHQSAAFLDGTAAGKFLIVRDKKTGEYLDPKTDVALNPDRYEYVPAKGTGKIVSWAIVHGKGADGAVARSAVGIVELDEGPWWWTEFQGVDLDADLLNVPVKVTFVKSGPGEDDETVPVFVGA